MNKWASVIIRIPSEPRLWLGVGIGMGIGVIVASGFGFDKSDAARFLGALVGALVAVTGAISLHYLKEHEEREERRNNLRLLITTSIAFSEGTIDDVEKDDDIGLSLENLADQISRTKRFAEKYEFEDIQINSAFQFLSQLDIDLLKPPEEELSKPDGKAYAKKAARTFLRTLNKACNALDRDVPRMTKTLSSTYRSSRRASKNDE